MVFPDSGGDVAVGGQAEQGLVVVGGPVPLGVDVVGGLHRAHRARPVGGDGVGGILDARLCGSAQGPAVVRFCATNAVSPVFKRYTAQGTA